MKGILVETFNITKIEVIWRNYFGFPIAMEVSNTGLLRVYLPSGEEIIDAESFTFTHEGKETTIHTATCVATMFIDYPCLWVGSNKLVLSYKDGNKDNRHATNLLWVKKEE